MPVRKAQWKNDTQFNFGTPIFDNVEVIGSGDNAVLQLTKVSGNNNNDIPFTDPAKYTFSNPAELEISAGKGRLKASTTGDTNFTFTDPAKYIYDSGVIEVTGGVARPSGTPIFPYAWWHLNESSGTNAPDVSGNGRNGTTQNMEDGDWQTGKLNNCLYFDGTNEHVDCGDIAGFERFDKFSVECWFQTTLARTQFMVAKQDDGANKRGWALYIREAAGNFRVSFVLSNDSPGGNYIAVEHPTNAIDGNWHHAFVTYDGSNSATGVKIYVDGDGTGNIIILNNLSATILNTATCQIGTRGGSTSFAFEGKIDEVVIYDEEVPAIDVAFRYNASIGTELMRLGYSIDNPDIINNNGYAFTIALDTFIETSTKPTLTAIKYQLSSDNGTTWKWWNGASWVAITGSQTDTWYFENESNSESEVHTNIENLASSGTFKFRAFLHSESGVTRPELDNIYIAQGASYPLDDNLYIDTKDAIQVAPAVIIAWLTTTITANLPANTDVKIMFSVDGRTSWKTWGGSSWDIPADATLRANATSITDAETNFADLPLGNGTLDVRVFLFTSDASTTPDIDNINVISDAGYEHSGYYESTQYQPENNTNGVCLKEITFTTIIPGGTTLTIEARSIDNVLEEVAGYQEYNDNDNIDICGDFIQWKGTFTSTGQDTPKINLVEVAFHTLIGLWNLMANDISIIKKIETKRWRIVNNQMIFYDDDNITPLLTFDLKDKDGNPTEISPYERDPV